MKLGWLDTSTSLLHAANHEFEQDELDKVGGVYRGAMCLLEACHMASEDPQGVPDFLSDAPLGVHDAFACFGRDLNDCCWPDNQTRTAALLPLIPLLLQTDRWSRARVFRAFRKIADAVNPRLANPVNYDEIWEGRGPTAFASALGDRLERAVPSSMSTTEVVDYLAGIAKAFVEALGVLE